MLVARTSNDRDRVVEARDELHRMLNEGDHVALLSAPAEMGFRFRMDFPDEAMELTALIFRNSAPSREEDEHLKSYKEKAKLKKESLKLRQKESRRFNPVIIRDITFSFQTKDRELDVIEMVVYGDVIRPGNECRCKSVAEMRQNEVNRPHTCFQLLSLY